MRGMLLKVLSQCFFILLVQSSFGFKREDLISLGCLFLFLFDGQFMLYFKHYLILFYLTSYCLIIHIHLINILFHF